MKKRRSKPSVYEIRAIAAQCAAEMFSGAAQNGAGIDPVRLVSAACVIESYIWHGYEWTKDAVEDKGPPCRVVSFGVKP